LGGELIMKTLPAANIRSWVIVVVTASLSLLAVSFAAASRVGDDQPVGKQEAPDARVTTDPDGTLHLPPLTIPVSNLLTPAASSGLVKYFEFLGTPASAIFSEPPDAAKIAEHRRAFNEHFKPILQRERQLYPVDITAGNLSGVYVDVITPKGGVDVKNKRRVLIELHGGGFIDGARVVGAIESVPVASLEKIKVLAVDYRQAPEYRFPAASDDVVAVYRELLKTYKPENIGIYGCSAGGLLTAEATARIESEKLPRPGAIGIFCAGAGGLNDGDSGYLGTALIGYEVTRPNKMRHPSVDDGLYFVNANLDDPLVLPIRSTSTLAKFPPTLIITSSRDNAASSAMYTHSQLVKLGVYAELHVWADLPHGFFTFAPDFPESRDAWDVVVRFFDSHLGT